MGPEEENGGVRERQRGRGSAVQLALLGVLASILGVALGLLIDWFPTPASTQADPIDTLWDVLLIASVPIFVIVQAVVLYCVWRFRMRPGQELMDGPPIHGNTRLEVVWTIIPAVLILGLCAYAYAVLHDIEDAQANEETIVVTGQQFAWTFQYGEERDAVKTSQLYLVEDQPVRFIVRSRDVIHDFWVPAFRMKIDAVPGIDTSYRITPNRRGTFPVVCAELCGLGHAYMRQSARVVSREEFDRVMQERRQAAGGAGADGNAGAGSGAPTASADGKTLFTEGNGESTACGGCHTLADANTTGTTGPDLDEVLADQPASQILESIVEPDAKVTEGYQPGIMPPNYGQVMSKPELDALVKYLQEVANR